jgi:muramoyltetrapeptide carboxypeptidase
LTRQERHSGTDCVKPRALRSGDTIGIIAPSGYGPASYPHRVERGKQFLESLGYRVVLGEHIFGRRGDTSGTAEERLSDIHHFFADDQVRAIISAIGGNQACHLLPGLDFDLIRRNPKIFMGYSDVTVLNLAIHTMTGLVTFNGPGGRGVAGLREYGSASAIERTVGRSAIRLQ